MTLRSSINVSLATDVKDSFHDKIFRNRHIHYSGMTAFIIHAIHAYASDPHTTYSVLHKITSLDKEVKVDIEDTPSQ